MLNEYYERLIELAETGDADAAEELVQEATQRGDWIRVKQGADVLVGDCVWVVTRPGPILVRSAPALHRIIKKQIKGGLLLLPPGFKIRLLPKPKEVKL